MTPSIESWIYLSLVYIGLAVTWIGLVRGLIFVFEKFGEREEG